MICAKTKQWGNSIGIIIPKDVVREMNIKPDEEICIEVTAKKGNVLKELFGALPSKKSAEEVLKQARENESRYF
ncbi:AbrB/MazE/SpoVT family DNA-binding domain-containing protein [Candidatus Woesearchaeota archaeon]|nr:AbrB/MazE/SpoVT family DNA-binding domain-containing protein [Candidatus Woesearchaeota archaeon]